MKNLKQIITAGLVGISLLAGCSTGYNQIEGFNGTSVSYSDQIEGFNGTSTRSYSDQIEGFNGTSVE